MKRRYQLPLIILLFAFALFIVKVVVDHSYYTKSNNIRNLNVTKIELDTPENNSDLYITDLVATTQFVEKLDLKEWKPKYFDVNTYFFPYRVTLNNNVHLNFSIDNHNKGICLIDDENDYGYHIYLIPQATINLVKNYSVPN